MKGNDYQEKSASVILSKPTKIIRIEKIKKVIKGEEVIAVGIQKQFLLLEKELSKVSFQNYPQKL